MAIDERTRHELFLKLEHVLGPEEATTLMEHLPPIGWADVATKQDLEHFRAATKQDIEHLRVATKQDIEHLRVATKTDLENLEVRLEYKLMAQFRGEMNAQTRTMILAMSTLMTTIAALAFTAARLI